MDLYKVKIKNRVLRKGSNRRLKGRQGKYYEEEVLVITDDSSKIKDLIIKQVQARLILGKPKRTYIKYFRQVKIMEIEKVV